MKEQSSNSNLIVTVALVGLVAAGGGFFAGMKYQQSKRVSFTSMMPAGQGRMGGGTQNMAGGKGMSRPVYGEIIKADAKTITVKSRDGSSKIVLLSETGQIYKAVAGAIDDLKIGTQVSVFGSANPDGSVTAQNIQIASTVETVSPTPSK